MMDEIKFDTPEDYTVRIEWNWISVGDRLPENDDEVLTYTPNNGVNIGAFYKNKVSYCDSGWDSCGQCGYRANPTHWMCLPKPPEE